MAPVVRCDVGGGRGLSPDGEWPNLVDRGQEAAGGAIEVEAAVLPGCASWRRRACGLGYRRCLVLRRFEGWEVGKKWCYRLYIEEGLALRRKRPWPHATAVHREQRRPATTRSAIWSMDLWPSS